MDNSLQEASYKALQILGKYSTCEEILKTINESGLYPKRVLYDTMSVVTPIEVEINTEGYNSRFVKRGTGIYGIKSFEYIIRESETDFNFWNIYVTPELRERLSLIADDDFCKSIYVLSKFLNKWDITSVFKCDLPCLAENKYPIILGTEEEVRKRRIDFKDINGEMCSTKIKLIHLIADSNICDNFDSIHKLINDLQESCEINDRYAFYMPKQCQSEIVCHPVIFSYEKGYFEQCYISSELTTEYSGFIMMPYDKNNDFIFTPKFYQALCHELFHSQVIDIYRGSKRINEGLPEVYSEICYYNFVEKFIKKLGSYSAETLDEFKQSYMRFRMHGSYKLYYNFVMNQLKISNEIEGVNGFSNFNYFICMLLHLSIEQIRDENNKNKNNKHDLPLLQCSQVTPYWQYVFERSCNELKRIRGLI